MASNDADQYLATQMDLIKSDSVLRPVVQKFRLREVEKDQFEDGPKLPSDPARTGKTRPFPSSGWR